MESGVAVIIVNYNGELDTIECVNSLFQQEYKPKVIVIVDNDSEIVSKRHLLNEYSLKKNIELHLRYRLPVSVSLINDVKIVFIENDSNGGFSKANNIGIKYVQLYENISYIWLLNNDTVLKKSAIYNIITFCSKNKSSYPLAISPKVISYYNNGVDSEGFAYLNLLTSQSSHQRKFLFSHSYLVGSSLFLTNISKIPLFDENYFLYYEDADYSIRLKENGFFLKYLPVEIVFHKISRSTKKNFSIEEIKIKSMIYFFKKNFRNYLPFLIITRSFFYLINGRISHLSYFLKSLKSK